MSQPELLKRVIRALEEAGIPYMITGSVVSSLQGEPRSTHDIDIVVAFQESDIKKLLAAFSPPDFYLDENQMLNAVRRQRLFNLIDTSGGDKVDFWMLTGDPFDQSRFARKCGEQVMGMAMQVSRPEDTILAKLRWAKLSGGSEKQFRDALRVYEVQFGQLDLAYLESWVKTLGIESLWARLQAEAEPA